MLVRKQQIPVKKKNVPKPVNENRGQTTPNDTSTESTESTVILTDRSTAATHSLNSLSVPDSATTTGAGTSEGSTVPPPTARSEPVGISPQNSQALANAGITTTVMSIEGDVIWEDAHGTLYKRTNQGCISWGLTIGNKASGTYLCNHHSVGPSRGDCKFLSP